MLRSRTIFLLILIFCIGSFVHLHRIVSTGAFIGTETNIRGGGSSSSEKSSDTISGRTIPDGYDNGLKQSLPPLPPPIRILHVVTSLSEFDTGTRGTKKGNSRLLNRLLPVLNTTVWELSDNSGEDGNQFIVDVYLVLGYTLSSENLSIIKRTLPPGTKIDWWNDAVPLAFDENAGEVRAIKRSLARGHRYVVGDRFDKYDFFSCWEDDMLVRRSHVTNFLDLSNRLSALAHRPEAAKAKGSRGLSGDWKSGLDISKEQYKFMIPGFVRVEISSSTYPPTSVTEDTATATDTMTMTQGTINSETCCQVNNRELVAWEASDKSFRLRIIDGDLFGLLPVAGQNERVELR